MNIGSGSGFPSANLSNFSPHIFEVDGIACNSMEGFLQSLKFSNIEMQKHVCTLVGRQAKFKGKKKKWWKTQTLHWQGKEIKRGSKEFQELLDKAFWSLAKNKKFQKALLATNGSILTHSIGKKKQNETVLTEQEFCSRLMKIREKLQQEGELE